MKRSLIRRLVSADADDLLGALTTAQYLTPHEPVAQALNRATDALGVCPQAVSHAVKWLGVDPATSIGRLRRTELMQLARSIHRFWRHATAAASATAPTTMSAALPSAGTTTILGPATSPASAAAAVAQPSERPS
jgi:hypothetical protein